MSQVTGAVLFGKYRVEELIGEGASAEVYRVRHVLLDVDRAVKLLQRGRPGLSDGAFSDYRDRLKREARLGARLGLGTANIVKVLDYEATDDQAALVMEHAAGGSLETRIEEVRLGRSGFDTREVVRIAGGIAAGLAAIHAADLVHRDLKPSNVLFDDDERVMVADLGLAQADWMDQRSVLDEAAPMHPGTPAFMSPEQRESRRYLTKASDVYALGLILMLMLTGRHYSSLRPATPPSALRTDVPSWLDDLVRRMLADDPGQRPFDGSEVHGALLSGSSRLLLDSADSAESPAEQRAEADLIQLAPGVAMEFVRVPAGSFTMGAVDDDPEADEDERAAHEVYLDTYWIARTPVTNRQFAAFVDASRYRTEAERKRSSHAFRDGVWLLLKGHDWRHPGGPSTHLDGLEDHPVVHVTWNDATAFCEWLSCRGGRAVRLPTEAEWEKAARGALGRAYPWGDESPRGHLLNFADRSLDVSWADRATDDGYERTSPAGRYRAGASPYGALDMAGNVWQWVADWYDGSYYEASPRDNPTGPVTGSARVMRGGSWGSDARSARSSYRDYDGPSWRQDDMGFRCACS